MQTFLTIVYVLVCLFLILVVLLQSGKGGGMGTALGGGSGGAQQVFGGAGAGNILTRATAVSAALFMILSATLAYMSSSPDASLRRAVPELVENVLQAYWCFFKDHHYVIGESADGERHIRPVAYQSTGIVQEQMHWCHGLHQMLQLKENLSVTPESIPVLTNTNNTTY